MLYDGSAHGTPTTASYYGRIQVLDAYSSSRDRANMEMTQSMVGAAGALGKERTVCGL